MARKPEAAYAALRQAILSAEVLPGTRFSELEWSERLGVGRFAVREALKRLDGEGLVVKVRSRYQVPFLTADEVHQIRHLRAVLEAGAVRLLPGKPPREALRAIREAARDYENLVKRHYWAGAREADLRFHHALVRAAENPRLLRAYESANLPLLHVTVGANPTPLDDFTVAVREHLAIYTALDEGKPEKAAALLEKHLKRGEREVLEDAASALKT